MKLSKRERDVLAPAVLYNWNIEINRNGTARWDGDVNLPFRAFKTLDQLVDKGLLESLRAPYGWKDYRATAKAREYKCTAARCQQGNIYGEDPDSSYDKVIAKCTVCEGTGLVLNPK